MVHRLLGSVGGGAVLTVEGPDPFYEGSLWEESCLRPAYLRGPKHDCPRRKGLRDVDESILNYEELILQSQK